MHIAVADLICVQQIGSFKPGDKIRIMYIPYEDKIIVGSLHDYSTGDTHNFGNDFLITDIDFNKHFILANETTEVLFGK